MIIHGYRWLPGRHHIWHVLRHLSEVNTFKLIRFFFQYEKLFEGYMSMRWRLYHSIYILKYAGGLPLVTYAPRWRGGGSSLPVPFHCALHAKRGEGVQIACKKAYVINGRPLVMCSYGLLSSSSLTFCHLIGKPSITEGPSDVEVAFGSTAYLSCRAEGDPEPEIIWLHNK